MPKTVEFSPQHLTYMFLSDKGNANFSGLFGINDNGSTSNIWDTAFGIPSQAKIVLFSGAMPAQPRLMTSAMMANSLIFWKTSSECSTFSNQGSYIQVTTLLKSAYATGTATWFAWCYYWDNVTPPSTGGTIIQRIIGTVGTIGSGADLEISSTSIVTGGQYRIYNLRIALPSSYTY